MSADPIEIHVIADSTGDTAARVARGAQPQCAAPPARIVRRFDGGYAVEFNFPLSADLLDENLEL